MTNKAVLHLTGMTSTKYGGLEHYFLELIRLCNQKGYRTILQYEALPQSSAYLRGLEDLGAEIVVLATGVSPLQYVSRVAALIHSKRPEIVQTHFGGKCVRLVTPFIARVLGVRKVMRMVHSLPHRKKNLLKRLALNRYDHVLGVSNAVVDNLLYTGVNPDIVSTHYLGLFGSPKKCLQLRFQLRNELGIPERAIVIGCIAFDTPEKGVDILLEAFSRVVRNRPAVHLIVVGVEPHHSVLPDQAEKLGLSNYVHWAGIRDEGWKILNAADFYVQPSRSEGLPFTIMEAMSLKLPVVATQVGGIPEAVVDGETGYLADGATADSLAAAIERTLAKPTEWKTLGEAGYLRYLRMFRVEDSVKTLFEKYFDYRDHLKSFLM